MRSDFSNLTFHPRKGHSRVLMQQGQLVTDAQTNEQTAILLHYLRTLTRDLLGPHGGPDGEVAFELRTVKTAAELAKVWTELGTRADPPSAADLDLGSQLQEFGNSLPLLLPGRYYVDGLLVEHAQLSSLWHQPYGFLTPVKGRYLLVLDAWEQQISSLDRPDLIDPAFAPARGSDRAAVVWRVLTHDMTGTLPIPEVPGPDQGWWTDRRAALLGLPGERGLLSAGTRPPAENDSPCLADPEDGYRGETGQLIRVEVHTSGAVGTASVKWSFDNGSVQAPWIGVIDDTTLRIDPTALVGSFSARDWIELTGLQDDLDGTPGLLVEVVRLEDDELHVVALPAGFTLQATYQRLTTEGRKACVRRWNQQPDAGAPEWKDGARLIEENTDLDLGQGVQVQFHATQGGGAPQLRRYRRGDYWLVLARPGLVQALRGEESELRADGSVSPYGPDHHYAPLALVDVADDHTLKVVADHRRRVPVLPFQNFP